MRLASLLTFLSCASDFTTATLHSDLRAKTLNTRGAVYGSVVNAVGTVPPENSSTSSPTQPQQQRQRIIHGQRKLE